MRHPQQEEEADADYAVQIISECTSLDTNSLIITAKGLLTRHLISRFMAHFNHTQFLCFILNSPSSSSTSINSQISAAKRQQMYLSGGCFDITTRILAVDLLNRIVPIAKISGIFVFQAHKVNQASSEAFVLRMFRQFNKHGFIKAFSDRPEAIALGLMNLEKCMRELFVTRVDLWPRFRSVVKQSLEKKSPEIVELFEPLGEIAGKVQDTLMDIIEACLMEVKKCEPNHVFIEQILDEEAAQNRNLNLFKNLDFVVKRQLDGVWNEIGSKAKNLIGDLGILRKLLGFLTSYDCISFYEYLECIRKGAKSYNSLWLYTESAQNLFKFAKQRIYKVHEAGSVRSDSKKQKISSEPSLVVRIEENPKWNLLIEVIDEIKSESEKLTDRTGVLIVCEDQRKCSQLFSIVKYGCKSYMKNIWFRYLKRHRLDSKIENLTAALTDHHSAKLTELKLLKKHFIELQALEDGQNTITKMFSDNPSSEVLAQNPKTNLHSLHKMSFFEFANLSEAAKSDEKLEFLFVSLDKESISECLNSFKPSFVIMYDQNLEFLRELEVHRRYNSPGRALRVYFLMLEGTIEEEGFVNAIQRENKAFEKLIQEKSVMVVRSNQDGKSTLVSSLPIQGGRIDNMPSSNSISRKGGGTSSKTNPHKIVIDMREFRSALPGYLHLRNMELSPITLEVGDYILSPRICVERKSIPDLIGSFSSGRLYNQLTAMTRYYNVPILLIEFEASKPFMLQDSRFLGDEINPNSLITKLCLAALHFPEVRFVWSRGAHLTAEIFESLKEHEFEPDEAQAALIGLDTSAAPNTSEVSADNPESEEIMENTYENDELEDAEDNIFSDQHLPVDMLKSLPGINSSTLLSILNCQGIRNLYDLFNAEPETLSQIIGQSNSNMLLRFIQTEEDS